MVEIIFKSKNAVVINKPSGMPSEKDQSCDLDAMTATSAVLRDMGEPSDLWLIHRLDRVVGGVLLFARNKKYAALFSEAVRDRRITKKYYAVTEGRAEGGMLEDYIYKDARLNKAFVTDRKRGGVKYACLSYSTLEHAVLDNKERSLVDIELDTGRFHQIRVQFASRGLSLVGDGKYGGRDKGGLGVALFAHSISFTDGKREITVQAQPDRTRYPWSLFDFFKSEG